MAEPSQSTRRFLPYEELRPSLPEARVHAIAYGPEQIEERDSDDIAGVHELVGRFPVTWINVVGTGDQEILDELDRLFGIHPLVREDIVNTRQRPKVEPYETYSYIVTRMVTADGDGAVDTEQISMILGSDHLVTIQERPGDTFDEVRDRIRRGRPQVRNSGPDYLAYALLDSVMDDYFPLLDHFAERLEDLEEAALEDPSQEVMEEIHVLKRQLVLLRRLAWPQRDALGSLQRGELPQIQPATRTYLRDVYDHTNSILETLDVYRDLAGGLRDLYLNQVSLRMNEIMKVLTVVATIFIPLTFLAGIWGMNFQNMPELGLSWGYYAALAFMTAVALVQVLYFRRRGWL